jgi:hypothetical protein
LNLVPPIELTHILESNGTDNPRVAGGSEHGRREALPELCQRRDVQMVIVIVAEQDDIDRRQVLERHAGLAYSLGPDPAKRACTLRPDRISQDGGATRLDHKSRVVHESNGDIIRPRRLVQSGHALVLDPSRPLAARFAQHLEGAPSRRREIFRQGRIEEALAIEVIGRRPCLRLTDAFAMGTLSEKHL